MNSDPRRRLGQLIRERREELDLTQYDAEAIAGVAHQTWTNVEQGRATKDRTLRKVDRAMQWRPGSAQTVLAGGEPTPEPSPAATIHELAARVEELAAQVEYLKRQWDDFQAGAGPSTADEPPKSGTGFDPTAALQGEQEGRMRYAAPTPAALRDEGDGERQEAPRSA